MFILLRWMLQPELESRPAYVRLSLSLSGIYDAAVLIASGTAAILKCETCVVCIVS
jgi:hypothetical protein